MGDRVGIGWRPEFAGSVFAYRDEIDIVEVIADNHFASGRRGIASLRRLADAVPFMLHGVGLGLPGRVVGQRQRPAGLGELGRPHHVQRHDVERPVVAGQPACQLQTLIVCVQKIALACRKGLSPDGVRIHQFNGSRAGQTVFHLHFHVVPVYSGVLVRPHAGGAKVEPAELEKVAAKIRAAI